MLVKLVHHTRTSKNVQRICGGSCKPPSPANTRGRTRDGRRRREPALTFSGPRESALGRLRIVATPHAAAQDGRGPAGVSIRLRQPSQLHIIRSHNDDAHTHTRKDAQLQATKVRVVH